MSDMDLDRYRNEDDEIVAVFICPDSPFPYIQEYFEYLGANSFPQIENEHLLKRPIASSDKAIPTAVNEIAPRAAYESIYDRSIDAGWRLVNAGRDIPLKDGVIVFDVRDLEDYEHNHLSQSVHLEYKNVLLDPASLKGQIGDRMAYVICAKGNRSRVITDMLIKAGIRAVSLKGGMMDWSSGDLPRWRPETCVAFQTGRFYK
jgi:rhodanese-related sulfurtransferase